MSRQPKCEFYEHTLPYKQTFEQGAKPEPIFSVSEMERRFNLLYGVMHKLNLQAAWLTSHCSLIYFADIVPITFGRLYSLLVTIDKRVFVVSAPVDGGRLYRRLQYPPDAKNIAASDWHRDNHYRVIGDCLAPLLASTSAKLRVGIEFDALTVQRYNQITSYFLNCEFVDVCDLLIEMRLVKSPEEIDVLRNASKIADRAAEVMVKHVRPGVKEFELSDIVVTELNRQINKYYPHSEIWDSSCLLQSGINEDGAHNFSTGRELQKGDLLSLNVFPVINGYYNALERNFFVDHVPSNAHLDMWQKCLQIQARGIELAQPGVKISDLARQLNELYVELGLLQYRSIGHGHGVGVMNSYYGRDPPLELREDRMTVLRPGMTITMEPDLLIPQGQPGAGTYREHDVLLITENGNENLTAFPKGPKCNVLNFSDQKNCDCKSI